DAYSPGPTLATIANAMDVGAPSNFERLLRLYGGDEAALREGCTAIAVDDDTSRATSRARSEQHGEVFCPHTATAVHVLQELRADGTDGDWAVAATAHPAKFESVVEPLVGHPVE